MLESNFQNKILIQNIMRRFPGAIIVKPDETYIRSFPDRIILYGDRWAALETKRERLAGKRPNQEFYINLLNRMSFGRFINPENMEDILNEMEYALQP